MPLLVEATNQLAAAKVGLYGGAGSGKTRTATEIAIGLALLKPGTPIAFFDTEGGSDFMIPLCKAAGVKLLTAKARSFQKLMEFMGETRELGAVGLIDSISHTWDDLRESYEKELRRKTGLEIWDWSIIKPEWRKFTDEFLSSPCHMLVCGRSTDIWERVYNPEKGKAEVQSVGTKMKVEKETGYEPSLLIEMERRRRTDGTPGWDHVAIVVKDRADKMDGVEINHATYEDFLPHFDVLNLEGKHHPTDTKSDSRGMFTRPDHSIERKRQVEITLEKIQDEFILASINSRTEKGKRHMKELLKRHFRTTAWSEIRTMLLEDLVDGLTTLRMELRPREADE